MMNTFLLVAAALAPAVVLCVYVYIKDRVEKEPVLLLVKLLLLGALCGLPAVVGERFLLGILQGFFENGGSIEAFGAKSVLPEKEFFIYTFAEQFFCIAFVEEGLKLLVLLWATRKSEEFNCLFDGLIYAVFVSLGFAALENVLYVLRYGFMNALFRAFLSVPGHMFFAVMMGYNYSMWHITDKARELESYYQTAGAIDGTSTRFKSTRYAVLSLLTPMAAHCLYNASCTLQTGWSFFLLFGFVLYMYITCFGRIRKMSRDDSDSYDYAQRMVRKAYPQLGEFVEF